jgi:hypothetical protein
MDKNAPHHQIKDRYHSSGVKVLDFLGGAIGISVLGSLCFSIISGNSLWPFILILFISVIGVSLFVLKKKGYRYIVFGAVTALIIPLLIFGGCLLIIESIGY